jgi:diguanylate cyclase (GGDEF)-like protein
MRFPPTRLGGPLCPGDCPTVNTPDDQETDSRIGLILDGRYEITEFIARGGMGTVYKAIQRPLGREVAVKILTVKDKRGADAFQARFFLEASLCARLTHPNVVRVFDYGTNREETFYIVMEFIEGHTLEEVLNNTGRMEPLRAVNLMKQACSALSEAHNQGLVHRDLKLRNLMVTHPTENEDFLRVLDFGLVTQTDVRQSESNPGGLIGSPMYMSPEQIQDRNVDLRTDIYALGVVLFMLLTGKMPFRGKKAWELFREHMETIPPLLNSVLPSVTFPESLQEIVRIALSKDPEERFYSTQEMSTVLEACAHELRGQHTSAQPHPYRTPDILDGPTIRADTDKALSPEVYSLRALHWLHDTDSETGFRDRSDLKALHEGDLSGYVAYIDFNCPFCYALHERLVRWSVADRIEWRLVVHASHVLEGPFTIMQQTLLANEVFSLQRRAPDIQVLLPPKRCSSDEATQLLVTIERTHPDRLIELRTEIYRALWQKGKDIGDRGVLESVLLSLSLPPNALDSPHEATTQLDQWQQAWEDSPTDCSIPVLTHTATKRVLIGLPAERTLMEFLLQERTRVVDSAVCYYQRRPIVLVMGDVEHLWLLLSEVRHHCDILHAPNFTSAEALLNGQTKPDVLLVDNSLCPSKDVKSLSELARDCSVPWLLATHSSHFETEEWALSLGAAEFLPLAGDCELARARLQRILCDRFSMDQLQQEHRVDVLTGLLSRRVFLDQLEEAWQAALSTGSPLSLLLIDLDHFNAYNKLHGHLEGDQCLRGVAAALSDKLGTEGVLLARFGGNEFIILPKSDEGVSAETIGEHVLSILEEAKIPHGVSAISPHVTVSVGIGSVPAPQHAAFHDLLECADKARMLAKEAGGNRIHSVTAE